MEHFNPILGSEPNGQKFITCGEIMLRLTPPNYEKIRMASAFEASYGGSEANIALALANLGVDSTFFSVVPNSRLHRLLPTPSPFWALPLPSTAWHWVWITSPAPWAATSPAPPIWHRWISRQT